MRAPRVLIVLVLATLVPAAGALLAFVLLGQATPLPVSGQTPTPLATGASAGTGPVVASPAPSVLSDRFGFVWASLRGAEAVTIQPETGQGGFELPTQAYRFSPCSCSVSPDGTRVAYWAGSAPGEIELRVVEVARPGVGTTIYKPPADERGTALGWSSDGSGILFSLEGWSAPGGPVGDPSGTSLLVIDATGGTARTIAMGGGVYVPLAWDRVAGIAAAGVSGEGGYMTAYVTVRTTGAPAPQRTVMPGQIGIASVRVSTDQRFILGVFFSDQGRTLRWWKLAEPGPTVNGRRIGENVQPTWRPLSSQIAWVENGTVQLFDVERDVTSVGGSLPAGDYTSVAFRVDGSAVAAGVGTSYLLLDLSSGRTAALASLGYVVGSLHFVVDVGQPPLNALEMRVINALGMLGITGRRAQLPFRDASIWAEMGTRFLFVNAYPLGTVDPNFAIIDERRLAGIQVQHVRRASYPEGTTSSRFECAGNEYWVSGDVPPGFIDMDAFVERFVRALGCSQ